MSFKVVWSENSVQVVDSYKVLFSRNTINDIYNVCCDGHNWNRSKFGLYVEWAIHSICYWLHIQRKRTKDVDFEYNKSWFKNLFKCTH